MLKKRVVATVLVKDGLVVQSVGFSRYLPIGKPRVSVEYLNRWGVDEIILLDMSATRSGHPPDFAMVRSVSAHCHVPLTVGGGISEIDHISELMHCGADKVAFNQAALHRSELLVAAAHRFGAQCVVASVDGCLTDSGYRAYDYLTGEPREDSPAALAARFQALGAGEILLNSVDRDGSYRGYDIKLINSVCSAVTIPVICAGGAGGAQHFIEVLNETDASAAAAANFFHFTEHSVTVTKALVNKHVPVRHEIYFDYIESKFDARGRLLKKSDQVLENMLYIRIEKEII